MKKKAFLSAQVIFLGIVLILIFGVGVYGGTAFIDNSKTNILKMECDAVDRALEQWAKAHKSVNEASITYSTDGKVSYSKKRLYPENLNELGEIQNMGYFSKATIDLSNFTYATMSDGTKYKLEVTLPNGTVYTSPRSNR